MIAVQKAQAEDLSKTKTLVAVMNDLNRSNEERITAATALKKIHKEQLANY